MKRGEINMQKAIDLTLKVVVFILICWAISPASMINAEERLRYSGSVQIDEAFKGAIDSFSKTSGIKVNKYVSSSSASVYRLMNGLSDLASTTRI